MNREIKFRFWDGEKFLYISLESLLGEYGEQFQANCYSFELIPQQFTGLKDKNSKEIYEGDILKKEFDASCMMIENKKEIICFPGLYMKRKFDNFEVVWKNMEFFYKCLTSNDNHIGLIENITYEIIGNVFENPELLK